MKPKELEYFLIMFLQSKFLKHKACMIWGPPGVGKSSIVLQVCSDLGMGMVETRLVHLEPADIIGIPYPKGDDTIWLRPRFLPREGTGVTFWDDLPQAYPATQNALSEIVLDNKAGTHVIPEGWRNYICAGNEAAHRAAVHEMPSHLANRLIHITLEVDLDDWKEWAYKSGIADEVISYLNYCHNAGSRQGGRLYNPLDFKEKAYPTPRSWEATSDYFKTFKDSGDEMLQEVISGCIGAGVATEFMGFLNVWGRLPDPIDILEGRINIVPEDAAQRFALCGALVGAYMKNPLKYGDPLLEYSEKLPPEWGVGLLVRDAYRADKKLSKAKKWTAWSRAHSSLVL